MKGADGQGGTVSVRIARLATDTPAGPKSI